jgi:glycosyltransferase involved in cell wall biosynthesis
MSEICIDVRMAFNSGIGTYVRNIIQRLKKSPVKLRLLANEEIVIKWPQIQDCDLILSKIPLYSIEEQLKLPFLIPSCDIFWTPHYNTPLLPIRAKKRLVTIHDVYHLAYGKTLSVPKRLYAKTVINSAARLSDIVLTDSVFSKDEIVKYTAVSKDKIVAVPLGVDRAHFKGRIDISLIKEKYKLPNHFFLFVSTLAPHKNIERLLLAWNQLPKDFAEWKLVLIGKKVKNNSWQKVIDQNPTLKERLVFLGQVDDRDLPAIYQLAYATVHPSLYEGFGLTPLESMSCGSPVVVSRIASLPEVCGDCAVYVDPYSVEDIMNGMRKLILDKNLHAELKENGLRRSEEFNWDKTADRHREIIESLL